MAWDPDLNDEHRDAAAWGWTSATEFAGGEPAKDAAVLIALVEHEGGPTVILTRRADTLRSHTGQVALPGGRIDPGETPWAAALREAQEEIGLDPATVTLAGLSTPYRTGNGYHIVPVVGLVSPPVSLFPNPAEVADIFEPPFAFLMDPANHQRRQAETPDGETRRFYAMTWGEQLIWGVTAGILRALHDRLYGEPLE
jgi:8-oxo-dGTP pyrophosphatase MutT (NUDIX family)